MALSYGVSIILQKKTNLTKLLNKCLKLMSFLNSSTNIENLYQSLKILNLKHLLIFETCKIAYSFHMQAPRHDFESGGAKIFLKYPHPTHTHHGSRQRKHSILETLESLFQPLFKELLYISTFRISFRFMKFQ